MLFTDDEYQVVLSKPVVAYVPYNHHPNELSINCLIEQQRSILSINVVYSKEDQFEKACLYWKLYNDERDAS